MAGASMDVFVAGTNTRVSLFAADGSSKPNPFVTTVRGEVIFRAANGDVDVVGVSATGLLYSDLAVRLYDAEEADANIGLPVFTDPLQAALAAADQVRSGRMPS